MIREEENKKEIILSSSDEAAQYKENIKGWVDRNGHYWGDGAGAERQARWSSCTHVECEDCKKITPKHYHICKDCREKRRIAAYAEYERKRWDGKTPVYSEKLKKFFFDKESIAEVLEEMTAEDARMFICEPEHLWQIGPDVWEDVLFDCSGELPDEVQDAVDKLNEAIVKAGPVSWMPGEYAAMFDNIGVSKA